MKKRVLKKRVKRLYDEIIPSSVMWIMGERELSINIFKDIKEMKYILSEYQYLLKIDELIVVSPPDPDTEDTRIVHMLKQSKESTHVSGFVVPKGEQKFIGKYINPVCDNWVRIDLRKWIDGNIVMTDFCYTLLRLQKKSKGEYR